MRGFFGFVISALAVFLILSCASAPPSGADSSDLDSAVSVPVQGPKKRAFFSSVNSEAVQLAEIGSPQSLRQAAFMIHRSVAEEYTDAEKTLLYISAEIMKIVWPSEAVSWDVPSGVPVNQYVGAIESARKGIYDLSTNSSDFFSTLLPSLVLLSPSGGTVSSYYGRAEAALSSAISMNPGSVLASYLMGVLCLRKNENEKALSYFTQSNGAYSAGTKEIIQAIANACYLTGNYELALSFGEELLPRYPQDTELLKLCARASYAIRDFDRTEGFVVRVLLLEPDNTDYVLLRARILMERGDYIRASSLLDVSERKSPASRDYYLLRARLQRDWNKNSTAAIETVSAALERYPSDLETQLLAAETASMTGLSVNGRSAQELAQEILASHPDSVPAMKICMDEYIKKGDFQKAYSLSSRLAALPSAGSDIFSSHIDICLALKKITEAQELAQRFYRENPADETAVMAYIKVLVASSQRTEAMSLIASLIPGAGQRLKSFLYYERSLLQRSEELALEDLRASLTANPRNKDSLYRLYELYYAKKDWRRAQYYLKQVIALDPSDASLLKKNTELDKLLGR